jgi:protein FAM126
MTIFQEKSLQPIDLRRWEENSNKEISWGPHPQIDSLNAQNRLRVLTCLLFVYNQQLSLIQKPALYHLCKMASSMVNQGFTKHGHAHRASYGSDPMAMKPLPRIPISEKFLLEILHAAYFAMFNEFASAAIQAVDDIHSRACFEMYPDVVLVTNAIRHSLHANPSGDYLYFNVAKTYIPQFLCVFNISGQPSDGPMGISVALTPVTTTVTVSKSMITNASFRTKKLPGKDSFSLSILFIEFEFKLYILHLYGVNHRNNFLLQTVSQLRYVAKIDSVCLTRFKMKIYKHFLRDFEREKKKMLPSVKIQNGG